jgi:hypothetical protein
MVVGILCEAVFLVAFEDEFLARMGSTGRIHSAREGDAHIVGMRTEISIQPILSEFKCHRDRCSGGIVAISFTLKHNTRADNCSTSLCRRQQLSPAHQT